MVELAARTPCAELLPVTHGTVTLREIAPDSIFSVAPFKGREVAVSAALRTAVGVGLPDPGRVLAGKGGQVVWTGQGQFFVFDAALPELEAAVTDQSDAWAVVTLEGAQAREVLARLCPLNLAAMNEGSVARSLIGHLNAVIVVSADGYDLMVFRSMAKTLVHELSVAMQGLAARAAL